MTTERLIVNSDESYEIELGDVFSDFSVTGDSGGAIWNEGTISGDWPVILTRNSAQQDEDWAGGNGGAIFNSGHEGVPGSIALNGGSFTENTATGCGGAIYNSLGTVTLTDVTFSSNNAEIAGGAIYNSEGDVTISDSSFIGNGAEQGDGGAIHNDGVLTLNNVTFSDNYAGGGAAITSYGTVEVDGAYFSNNNALEWGGGAISVYDGTMMLDNVTFYNNNGAEAGAIANFGGSITLKNVFFELLSDTIYNYAGTLTIAGSVMLGNAMQSPFPGIMLTNDTYGTLNFDISDMSQAPAYTLLSDWARVDNQGELCITVSGSQAIGTYHLAGNTADFLLDIIYVYNTDNVLLGTFDSMGAQHFVANGKTFTLSNGSDILSLNISQAATDVRTNLLSNGYSQIVAWDAAQGKVGYVATDGQTAPPWAGIWEWSGDEATMWKVVAVGRFSADVAHDGILLYNGNSNTFAAWTDLGRGDYGYISLCYVGGNFQTLALADFDNNGLDDVIIYDENGSFGIVSDARTYHDVWHVDNPTTNVQQVIGAGYFGNADGKSDILVKKTDENAYFLWHNQDSTFNTWDWSQTYIGSLDDDWVVAAIGDFQGDGVDDIIMWQQSTGYMFAWEDGKSSNQRWVGALDASQWEVAAVGDYDGDGKEDLLLRELVSGWGGVGYWGAGNASNWTDLNARIETDMDSKFAVIA